MNTYANCKCLSCRTIRLAEQHPWWFPIPVRWYIYGCTQAFGGLLVRRRVRTAGCYRATTREGVLMGRKVALCEVEATTVISAVDEPEETTTASIRVFPVDKCKHQVTMCLDCVESWSWDWNITFGSDPVCGDLSRKVSKTA